MAVSRLHAVHATEGDVESAELLLDTIMAKPFRCLSISTRIQLLSEISGYDIYQFSPA